jgi:hypothetical protein
MTRVTGRLFDVTLRAPYADLVTYARDAQKHVRDCVLVLRPENRWHQFRWPAYITEFLLLLCVISVVKVPCIFSLISTQIGNFQQILKDNISGWMDSVIFEFVHADGQT